MTHNMNKSLKPNFDKLTYHNFLKLSVKIDTYVSIVYASEILFKSFEGVQVMNNFNLQCKSFSQYTKVLTLA